MSNLVPDGWEVVTLNDQVALMTDYVANGSFEALRNNVQVFDEKNHAMYVRLYDIRLGIGHEKQKYVDEASFDFLNKSKLIENDILTANIGANVGEMFLMPKVSEPATLAPNMIMMRCDDTKSSKFLYYYLASESGQRNVSIAISGSGQPKLNKTDFKKVRVINPPLPEQRKIAKILTSVDEVIEKTQAQIDKLKDLKTGMMQELLTNGIGHTEFKDSPVGRIPAEWEVKTVESILSKIIDYRGKAPPKSEVGVPLITAKNIRNGFINQEPREYIYEEQFNSWMVRGMPQFGDVFITTEAPLGNVAKVPNYKFAIGQRVLTLRPNELVCTEFLLFILQSEKFKKELDLQSTGSTVAGIKQSTFRKVLLPVPTIDEQIKISESLNSIVRRSDLVKDKLQSFKSLKKALMQDLLTGKVRVKVDSE